MIDLRSDTCSRPAADIRTVAANADVGDDVYDNDTTAKALKRITADLLGKEAAVYMPTAIMTNRLGIRSHIEPGDAVLFDQHAHVYLLEGSARPFFPATVKPLWLESKRLEQRRAFLAAVGEQV
jgi:threonine aldolase